MLEAFEAARRLPASLSTMLAWLVPFQGEGEGRGKVGARVRVRVEGGWEVVVGAQGRIQ